MDHRVKPGDDGLLLRRKTLVDAFPFVVADELLIVLEIHAVVAVGEFARLHVDEHRLDRLGGVHDGVEPEYGTVEAELTELLHRQDRRVAAHQRVADLRHVEGFADPLQFRNAARRLDENAVGAGADIAFGAAHGFVEVVDRARIGAAEDPGFRIDALGGGRLDLGLGKLDGNDLLADHVAATLWPLLILDQDGAHPHALVGLHRMHDVLDVAIAVVAVDENRQVARAHDIAHGGGDFAKALQAHIGHAVTGAYGRKAADEIGLEADLLDQPGAERVMGAGHHQESLVLDGFVDDLAEACRHYTALGFGGTGQIPYMPW